MPNPLEIDRVALERLVRRRTNDFDFETRTESEIRSEYIDPLFRALGWDPENSDPAGGDEWRREVSGIQGRADYFVYVNQRPILAIEAKRANQITATANRQRIDRTPEEKQVLRYTRENRVPWAVLTNFDRLLVFDADGERLLLAFDSPNQYLESLDGDPASSLRQISYAAVTGGSLEWLRDLALKHEVDEDFLKLLQEMRLDFARDLLAKHGESPELAGDDGRVDLDALLAVVQRVIDRLILVRFADDQEILRQHDLLANLLRQFEVLGDYRSQDELHAMLVRLWVAVDRIHDTTIFQQGHLCERLPLSNDVLQRGIAALNGVSFRKFTSDILGATYESYLGTTLGFDRSGRLAQRAEPEKRRWAGIYYTPPFVVHEIVSGTLGRKLDSLVEAFGLHAVERIRGLRVLDPACGSGTFLIQSYDLLARFYRDLNGQIDAEFARLTEGITDPFEQVERARHLPRPVADYPLVILTEHLYGVDIDGEAAEIATLNLVMRAFRELRALGRREQKLPLILNQNVKVGNSLVEPFSLDYEEYAEARRETLSQVRAKRALLARSESDQERRALLTELNNLVQISAIEAQRVDLSSIEPGSTSFDWIAEFPEVWVDEDGNWRADAGFDVIIGNPPYIRIQRLTEMWPAEAQYYREHYESAQHGNYDIYVLFVERALRLLAPSGGVGFILPHRFFTAEYGEPLRELIGRGKHMQEIVHFGSEQIFAGATTYTTLLFLGKAEHEIFDFSRVENLAAWREDRVAQRRVFESHVLGATPWNLVAGEGAELFERLHRWPQKLGDVADVFVGLQTSADKVFIMDFIGETPKGIVLRSEALGQDWTFEREMVRPIVSGADVRRYRPLPSRQYILFPYTVVDETAHLIPFGEMLEHWPRAAAYLEQNRQRLESREKGRFRDAEWHRFGRSQNLGIQGRVKLCIPRLVESLFATTDPDGSHCLDNVDVCGITLKPEFQEQGIEYLLGLVNSRLMRWYFPQVSVPFRGNWLSANRQYVDPLPFRVIDFRNPREVACHGVVVDCVRRILAEQIEVTGVLMEADRAPFEDRIQALEDRIDDVVAELFGLSSEERAQLRT